MSIKKLSLEKIRGQFQSIIMVEKNKERWVLLADEVCNLLEVRTGDRIDFNAQDGVADLRSKLSELNLKPVKGNYRVLIVRGADELSLDEANTLLKTLEEPPGYGRAVLLARNLSKIIATIRSRCTKLVVSSGVASKQAHNIFKASDFNEFLSQIKGLENDEIPDILEDTLLGMRSKDFDRASLAFYKKVARSYIRASNTNVNRKLLLEELYLVKFAEDQ